MTDALTFEHVCAPAKPIFPASGIASLGALVMRPVTRLRDRLATRRFERFSNHLLRDIGFERDWDGSIIGGERR
jgi:uncharacterized protein YjiS (DUF1127 family)